MVWGIVAAVLTVLVICLLMPIKSSSLVQIRGGFTNIEITPYILFMNFGLKIRFRIVYNPGEGLYIARITKSNQPRILFLAKQFTKESFREPLFHKLQEMTELFSVDRFDAFVKLGTDNAITTVYLCAMAHAIFDIMFSLQKKHRKNKRTNFNLLVTPSFEYPIINLNLEGIFRTYPTKIIRRIVRKTLKKLSPAQERKEKECIQLKT
ncbi:MAG: hypothetical protein GX802_07560 [Clostridiales bacterium]|jgi:hypothetical protein|nr:hypothetical protein [Clostridiales bacterium]